MASDAGCIAPAAIRWHLKRLMASSGPTEQLIFGAMCHAFLPYGLRPYSTILAMKYATAAIGRTINAARIVLSAECVIR